MRNNLSKFKRPRDEKLHPPTIKAADGETELQRFRVDAVIYAPTRKDAQDRLEEDIYLDAGSIVDA